MSRIVEDFVGMETVFMGRGYVESLYRRFADELSSDYMMGLKCAEGGAHDGHRLHRVEVGRLGLEDRGQVRHPRQELLRRAGHRLADYQADLR